MKISSLLVSIAALFITVLFTSYSQAARYLVAFKNPQGFAAVHSSWMRGHSTAFAGSSKIQIQDSLGQIQTLVIDVSDEAALQALAENTGLVIEKEVIHKAPAPVRNFEVTKPWSFDVNYAVSADLLKKQKPQKPQKPTDEVDFSQNRTPWGIKSVKAREAWELSNAGAGARVLILDSGIDKDHPALKNQIEEMKDFVGDNQMPYEVIDRVGHGTHVAGTIAAEEAADGFVGVAPKAKLLIGRVCDEEGCSNVDVARGINWGIEEKVDVINLSLGSDFGSDVEKLAVARADKAGVVIVAAAGNDGKNSVGFPAAYPTVLAVGAMDSKEGKADFSQWGPELDIMAPGVDVFSSVPMGSGCEAEASLVQGTTTVVNSSCFSGSALVTGLSKSLVFAGLGKPEDFQGKDLKGQFALVSRGEIYFVDKVKNAIAANAGGIIIYNNTDGLMGGPITEDGSTLAIPVVMIEKAVGEKLKTDLAAGQSASMTVQTKPSDYAPYNGTSMASPHVAGVVALVRATQHSLTPAQVRDVLKSTAKSLGPNPQNQYGSGLVDAEKAVTKAYNLR